MVIVAAAVLFALGFLAVAVLLVRGFMDFNRVESALNTTKGQLEYLFARNPFPSEKNLETERANLTEAHRELGDLLATMSRGQVATVEQSPAKFVAQFWEIRKALLAKTEETGISVAGKKEFGFGFERLMGGQLPAAKDVARLTQQLRIVQGLCGVLYDAGISELRGIGREEFEEEAVAGGASRPAEESAPRRRSGRGESVAAAGLNSINAMAGVVPEGEMFGKWRFVLTFAAREGALLKVLDGMAANPLFSVVAKVELVGDSNVVTQSGETAVKAGDGEEPAAGGAAKASGAGAAHERRVVAGRDIPLTVRMEVDVYQFAKPVQEPAAAAGGTP